MNADGTNLWDCGYCGTQRIAAGLTFCPNCRKDREDVPAVNRAGHSTVFGQPNDAQRAAMTSAVGISPPQPESDTPEETKVPEEPEDAEPTGAEMIDPEVTGEKMADLTLPDPTVLATEKASLAKEAFSSGDKAGAIALLDEAIALDASRADKWTKLKDQVIGAGEQW